MLKLVRLFIGKPCVAPSSDQKVQTRTTQRLLLDISQPNKVCTDYTFRLLQTYLSLALSTLISDSISKKVLSYPVFFMIYFSKCIQFCHVLIFPAVCCYSARASNKYLFFKIICLLKNKVVEWQTYVTATSINTWLVQTYLFCNNVEQSSTFSLEFSDIQDSKRDFW